MTGTASKSPKRKGILTIPEAQQVLKDKHGVKATLPKIRYHVDKLGLAERFGNYRAILATSLPKLAKALKE